MCIIVVNCVETVLFTFEKTMIFLFLSGSFTSSKNIFSDHPLLKIKQAFDELYKN